MGPSYCWSSSAATAALSMLIAVAGVSFAHASSITFNFAGTVTSVDSILSSSFTTGQTLSGSYTFDSLATNTGLDSQHGRYSPSVSNSLTFSVGTYSGGRTGSPLSGDQVAVWNDVPIGPPNSIDLYQPIWGGGGLGPAIATSSGMAVSLLFTLALIDDGNPPTALTGIGLPVTPPSLVAFNNANLWQLQYLVGTDVFVVQGDLTSLDLAPVPEPITMFLGGTGLLTLAYAGRRRLFR